MAAAVRSELAQLRYLYRYWKNACRGRPMPARLDFDFLRMPGLLPRLLLIDVFEEGRVVPRFRYKMLGTELVTRLGRDVTGKFVDEALEGEHGNFMIELYSEACLTRQPAMAATEYISRNDLAFSCQRLVLPLSDDGIRTSELLGLQVFVPGAPELTKLEFRGDTIRDVRLKAA